MKTTYLSHLALFFLTLGIGLSGCKKEQSLPIILSTPPYGDSTTQVISSEWFPASHWNIKMNGRGPVTDVFTKDVPGINDNMLRTGAILVFAFDKDDEIIYPLPRFFGAYVIGVEKEVGSLIFMAIKMAETSVGPSSTISFRYILIPENKLVAGGRLDYDNYSQVCAFYGIEK